jgi:hypothetical protein
MRWLILLLLLLGLVGAVAKNGCYVREFYGIGYTVHNPTERHTKMLEWLNVNAVYCKSSDYVVLWNNLSEWAGAADSTWLRNKVVHGYTDALERERK